MRRGRAAGVGATPWVPGGGAWHRGWVEAVGRVLLAAGHAWGGGVRASGRVVGWSAMCHPAVQSRTGVDAWAGAASGGSLRSVALVVVWGFGLVICVTWLLLYGEQVDY